MKLFNKLIRTLIVPIGLLSFLNASAQEVSIKLGNNQIAVNEYFTITVTLNNEQLKSYSNFPDIPGFRKRGISSQSSTNIINGQVSSAQSIVQNYAAIKEGKFKLPAFAMELNGKKSQSPGTIIIVGPAKQQEQEDELTERDPFAEFFNRGNSKEYVDVKEDAFLALTTTKDKVYIGEGFTATLAFYVSQSNKAEMQFYDLGNQMSSILKKIKPSNCWEENFGIEEIQPQEVTIEGRKYTEYKLYRATYYPLNKEPIKFPVLPLKMIKYKVAKVPSFFNNKKQDYKDFYSKAKVVYVKELPPHPLRDNVSVGQFKLEEKINSRKHVTGKSINYHFKISGEGNISSIRTPQIFNTPNFDVYPPNTFQDINRSGTNVTGSKSFNYFLIPKEPGDFKMNEMLQWIYFNTRTEKYDTLSPRITLKITGESSKNIAVGSSDFGDFTEIIESYDNTFVNHKKDKYIKYITNGFLIGIFFLTLLVIFKK